LLLINDITQSNSCNVISRQTKLLDNEGGRKLLNLSSISDSLLAKFEPILQKYLLYLGLVSLILCVRGRWVDETGCLGAIGFLNQYNKVKLS